MSSVGQAVGGIVGAVAGFFIGGGPQGALYGFQIGMGIGGLIDPPKGPNLQGPRLADLSQQTSAYGVSIPRIYGTVAVYGNVIWVEGDKLKEVAKKTKKGGKGGGSKATTTTYSYYATFAVTLADTRKSGPIAGIRRIWIGSKLFYDAGSDDIGTIYQSNRAANGFRLYLGSDTQQPDPRIQADKGVANTSAYRGIAYIVFDDYPLADHGNTLAGAQVKVEVVMASTVTQYARPIYIPDLLIPRYSSLSGTDGSVHDYGPYNPSLSKGVFTFEKFGTKYAISITGQLLSQTVATDGGGYFGHIGYLGDKAVVYVGNGGVSGMGTGTLYVGGAIFMTKAGTNVNEFQGAAVDADGTHLYVLSTVSGTKYLDIYDADLNRISRQPHSLSTLVGTNYFPWIPGTEDTFAVESGGEWLWIAYAFGGQVDLYGINSDGSLSTGHTFSYTTTPFMGSYGNALAIAADDAICCGAHNGGGFFVFERNAKITPNGVPLADIVTAECLLSGLLTSGDLDASELTDTVRGYRVTSVGALRAALEPLQGAWPFDVVPSGYQIKFRRRGAGSVITIPSTDLDARSASDAPGVQITDSREMDSQLPRQVILKHLDVALNYDVNAQSSPQRLGTAAVNIRELELPIVLTATECAGMAEVLLYLYWLERYDVAFRLPPTYNELEAADVITITGEWGIYELRLTEVNYLADGRLDCKAKYNAAAIYTPAAVADSGGAGSPTLAIDGPSVLALLDIPTLRDGYADAGFPAAMAGYYAGWPGGVLYRSQDNGQSWTDLQGYTGPVTMGYAVNAIGAGRTDIFDASNILQVRLISGTLDSVSELAMLNGDNHFAYGADGRWEIIAARDCVLQTDGTYLLSTLIRGRYGSEWAVGTHAVGDALVLLGDTDLAWIGMDTATIGASRLYRAITLGYSIDSESSQSFTYNGVNLKPLSPVLPTGGQDPVSNDWTIGWTRRTRIGGEWRDYVDASLGETSEAYQVDIYADGTYATVKRSLSVTTNSATYTNAQQITDFGTAQPVIYFKVRQVSSVVGLGYPLTASLAATSPADPYHAYMVLGLHGNGPDGSISIIDVTGKTVTANGNAKISTARYKFGGASILFDGSGDYLTIPDSTAWDFTGPFTIRGWLYIQAFASNGSMIMHQQSGGAAGGFEFFVQTDGTLGFNLNNAVAGPRSSAGAVTIGGWRHIEVSWDGAKYYQFVNGSPAGTFTSSTAPSNVTGVLRLGNYVTSGAYDLNGNEDDWQIYNGVCLHTTSFTPPSLPFSDT